MFNFCKSFPVIFHLLFLKANQTAFPLFYKLFYPGITLLLTILLSIGVQESTRFNSVFTCLNLALVLFIIVCGAIKADLHNWQLTPDEIPEPQHGKNSHGTGGFFPFGFSGMMAGNKNH